MELSNVIFTRNTNAKRYIIRILPDMSVRVTIPKYGTEIEAQKFLNQHIENLQQKIAHEQTSLFLLNQNYTNKNYQFKIVKSQIINSTDTIGRHLVIRISEPYCNDDKTAEPYIHYILQQLLRKEAKLYIPKRTMEFANHFNLNVTDIKINSAKTRWGSCTGRNSLNFSLFLMQLPYELIDYVILHELAHTVHKNHSSKFYDLLNRLCNGQHQALNKKLKKFSPIIKAEYFQKL